MENPIEQINSPISLSIINLSPTPSRFPKAYFSSKDLRLPLSASMQINPIPVDPRPLVRK